MKKLLLALVLFASCIAVPTKHTQIVPLEKEACGVFKIVATIDDCITIPFMMDTGASETSVPMYVIMTLFKAGKVSRNDILKNKIYILADGSKIECKRLMLRKISIGGKEVKNIEVSISETDGAELLLGQNVLSKLDKVTIDYNKNTLEHGR